MIKYIGSKRTLVPALQDIAVAAEAKTAIDMFTGTTRVAQAFKQVGVDTLANDIASYSKILADCYIATDASLVDHKELAQVIEDLNHTSADAGYFTETFCVNARFFQPKNGARIDAIRDRIEDEFHGTPYYSIAMTSLMEAADRVDSTTGVQMAYLKSWAPRAFNDLSLRVPDLLHGPGMSSCVDANKLVGEVDKVDLIYLDPPYNQHRYFTNYHIWETLVRWDKPQVYGVAQKRIDAREERTKSLYNRKPKMKDVFFDLISRANASTTVISYNNESWIESEAILSALSEIHESQLMLSFDYKRYVGAQIGIYSPQGKRVGKPTHLTNLEHVFIGSDEATVRRIEKASAAK